MLILINDTAQVDIGLFVFFVYPVRTADFSVFNTVFPVIARILLVSIYYRLYNYLFIVIHYHSI